MKRVFLGMWLMILAAAFTANGADWVSVGVGQYTDDLIASLAPGLERQTVKVEIERNVDDPNTYRVVSPYQNWKNPDPERFSYDSSVESYIVFHIVNKKYAWIEDFATGITYTDTEGSGPVTAVVAGSSMVITYGVDFVFERTKNLFASYRFGEVRLTREYELNGAADDNLLAKWMGSQWYANKKGAFCIKMPETAVSVESDWQKLGMGEYTDDIIASYNGLVDMSTFAVEVERNKTDPTLYRVVNPYALWPGATDVITYDTHGTYYMPFHIMDDGTAWIDDFDTGVQCYGSPIKVLSAAGKAVQTSGIDFVKANMSGALCRYDASKRRLTLPYLYNDHGTMKYCLDLTCDYGYWEGTNEDGAFALTVPDGSNVPAEADEEETWTSLGTGSYTANILSASAPQTMEVEVEQSDRVRWHYRLVNPYGADGEHYIEFCAYADHGDGYVIGGSTGMKDSAGKVIMVGSRAADTVAASGVDALRSAGMPGKFDVASNTLTVTGDVYVHDGAGTVTQLPATHSFVVTIPAEPEEEDPYAFPNPEPGNWHLVGTGQLRDDVMASVFQGVETQTFDVEIEEDLDMAGRYRILNPYKNWKNPFPKLITANPDNEGVIEFRVVNNEDVYFLYYNTGMMYDDIPLIAEQQAGSMILAGATYDEVAAESREAFATYYEGVIRQTATFTYDDAVIPSWLMYYDRQFYDINTHGELTLTMPDAVEDPNKPDPRVEWWPVGMGSYTDDFMPDYLPMHAESTTFPVEVQRNNWTPGVYRIVNPYRYWPGAPGIELVQRDSYMIIHTENAPLVWIESFYLGLINGATNYYAKSQVADWMADGYSLKSLMRDNPEAFGTIENGVITYPGGFTYSGYYVSCWMGGNGPQAQRFYSINTGGRMRIDLNPGSGISEAEEADADAPEQYYDLHGRAVEEPTAPGLYIVRRGNTVRKVML